MAERETKNKPKDLIEAVPEEIEKLEKLEPVEKTREERFEEERIKELERWVPKTVLGKLVKEEKNLDRI